MKYILLGLFITIVLFSCRKESGPYLLSGTIYMDCEEQQPLQYVILDLYASNVYDPQLLATDTIGADGKFNFVYDKSKKGVASIKEFYINSGPLGYNVKNLDPADLDKTKDLGSIYFNEKGTLRVNYITSDPRTAEDTFFVNIAGLDSRSFSVDTIIGPFPNQFSKEYIIHRNFLPGDNLHGSSSSGIIRWWWKLSDGYLDTDNYTVHGCGVIDEYTLEF